jgi:hypothetical protein
MIRAGPNGVGCMPTHACKVERRRKLSEALS